MSLNDQISNTLRGLRTRSRDWLVIVVIAAAFMGVLLTTTMRAVRTVETAPENQGVTLASGDEITSVVMIPASEVSYVVVWVKDGIGEQALRREQYQFLELEVTAHDRMWGAAAPKRIKREERTGLQFSFEPVVVEGEVMLTIRQHGYESVRLQRPHPEQIRDNENVRVALQLNEKRNWLTLLNEIVLAEDFTGHDNSFYLHRGKQILSGHNPYSCVLDEAETCIGYPAHLPGVYMLAAGAAALGVDTLEDWAAVWRPLLVLSWIGVGVIIFSHLYHRGHAALAVGALGFWLLNRWTLHVLHVSHTDFIGLFFLLLSILLLWRYPIVAAVLLGLSLSIKQVAILIVPLFLIAMWRQHRFGIQQRVTSSVLLLVLPLGLLLPFLLDDPMATVRGILDPAARAAQSVHGFAPSLDEILDVTHTGKSALLLVLVVAVYVAAWTRKIDLIGGALLVFAIMMGFTHMLYNQYFVWLLPFIPLALARRESRYSGATAKPLG